MTRQWKVVENAGYEGEYVHPQVFSSQSSAWGFAYERYEDDEREELHVDIALVDADGSLTYDY